MMARSRRRPLSQHSLERAGGNLYFPLYPESGNLFQL